jgi:hypothetical protein
MIFVDELESDEDDIDEDGAVYLESLEDKIKKTNGDGSFNISTSIMVTSYSKIWGSSKLLNFRLMEMTRMMMKMTRTGSMRIQQLLRTTQLL